MAFFFPLSFLLVRLLSSNANNYVCHPNAKALQALQPAPNLTIAHLSRIAFTFYFINPSLSPVTGGPNVTRGFIILPHPRADPRAYAPYARDVALQGYYAAIAEEPTEGHVIQAMLTQPRLKYWALAGHGTSGHLAARIALTLHPKVTSLVLLASSLPQDVDLRQENMAVTVLYGGADTIVPPASVVESFSRMAGDAYSTSFDHLGHYDFIYSTCSGNDISHLGHHDFVRSTCGGNSSECSSPNSSPPDDKAQLISSAFTRAVAVAHWPPASEKALSYGDNNTLVPGHNNSKVYPSDIRVAFSEIPQPDSSPQRSWWVFTPSVIKGGLIYYPGACVDGKAYFSLAFEIAARGHLVVIVQQPLRNASMNFGDANAVLDSNDPAFSGVERGTWAVGGHSLGGLAASMYVKGFEQRVYALVSHAGGFVNITDSELPVLQIFGTLDSISEGGYERYKYRYVDNVNLNVTKFTAVEGANHYQVGDYGYQYPDDIATISIEEQHKLFAEATVSFLADSLLKKHT